MWSDLMYAVAATQTGLSLSILRSGGPATSPLSAWNQMGDATTARNTSSPTITFPASCILLALLAWERLAPEISGAIFALHYQGVPHERAAEVALVLLDMTMPRMSGAETYHELRKIEPEVPVVLMSGYSEDEVADRFTGNGLAGFIQKPFRPRGLIDKLRRVLES